MIYPQDAYLPHEAEIIDFIDDAPDIFTLRLRLCDADLRQKYSFKPGQFNMIYLYGVGEVAISIVNDREFNHDVFEHTIQVVGRITQGMHQLKKGQKVGIRGPFGSSWPVGEAQGKDVVIMTGGLGNAPLVAATEMMLKNREAYGRIYVVQGVRHSEGLIYQDKYTRWNAIPNTQVIVTATEGEPFGPWQWYKGFVTEAVKDLKLDYQNTYVMSVGPEIMMKNVARSFIDIGVPEHQVFVSLERSMKCAIGHCGHCQMGKEFVCKDGAVYAYPQVEKLLSIKGV
ncbi:MULTISPECIES: FAD/NAD(P)-binding protein [Cysteiniphilum]|uniref:Ni/Fe hydrogenase subunit gamma n=1 Tax=Cysteiniphilum litorale TaxID=2056700 RepID=A0A8J2Z6I8_9GAMM|nr:MULTISPECIES: FAD/NAD(P)-binding protein [Cysteiniphilum]GGG06378.1 Ni/Fe hydrogenase subunit gamma [Cysteiniphilum litorale]